MLFRSSRSSIEDHSKVLARKQIRPRADATEMRFRLILSLIAVIGGVSTPGLLLLSEDVGSRGPVFTIMAIGAYPYGILFIMTLATIWMRGSWLMVLSLWIMFASSLFFFGMAFFWDPSSESSYAYLIVPGIQTIVALVIDFFALVALVFSIFASKPDSSVQKEPVMNDRPQC